jgi:hypothetical protein
MPRLYPLTSQCPVSPSDHGPRSTHSDHPKCEFASAKIIPKASSLAYCFDKLTSEVMSMNSIMRVSIDASALPADVTMSSLAVRPRTSIHPGVIEGMECYRHCCIRIILNVSLPPRRSFQKHLHWHTASISSHLRSKANYHPKKG